ncbi:hypothetical protein M5E89_15220 [Acidaminococcus intestini]|nr:hypothetical protein M5E89_15220 [Acidaminococcus intestini]
MGLPSKHHDCHYCPFSQIGHKRPTYDIIRLFLILKRAPIGSLLAFAALYGRAGARPKTNGQEHMEEQIYSLDGIFLSSADSGFSVRGADAAKGYHLYLVLQIWCLTRSHVISPSLL